MKGMIPLPDGLPMPEDASTKPFRLSGMFLLRGGKLLPLELEGMAVPCEEGYEDKEPEDENEGDGCCGAYKTGEMCEDCPRRGGGFLVAIEKAMAPDKPLT
jgi:hypothetical protein